MIKLINYKDIDILSIPILSETTSAKNKYEGTLCNNIMVFGTFSTMGYLDGDTPIVYDSGMTDDQKNKIKRLPTVSVMYAWYIGIDTPENTYCIIGRTLKELDHVLKMLSTSSAYQALTRLKMTDNKPVESVLRDIVGKSSNRNAHHPSHKILLYSNNLSLDMQVLCNLYKDNFSGYDINAYDLKIDRVFARDMRSPLRAVAGQIIGDCDVVFGDLPSLTRIDTGYELSNEIITPQTELSVMEIDNICEKVNNMIQIIKPYTETYGSVHKIPLTATGEVRRRMCNNACKHEPWSKDEKHKKNEHSKGSVWSRKQSEINHKMGPVGYARMRELFFGGDCGANSDMVGKLLHNQYYYDASSDYAAMMCHMIYPVSEFVEVKKKYEQKILMSNNDLMDIDRKKMWYAHIHLSNVRVSGTSNWGGGRDNLFWPAIKCNAEHSDIIGKDGGKLVAAAELDIYITDLDYDIFKQVYTWDEMKIYGIWAADAGLIPECIISDLLDLYRIKTECKGVEGSESAYEKAKSCVSSVYGVSVTRLIDDDVVYGTDGWKTNYIDDHPEIYDRRMKSIRPDNTFLSYQIGVWVTAWARHILWSIILPNDNKIVYRDTDSLTGRINDKTFETYHNWLIKRRKEIHDIYPSITPDMYTPMAKNGKRVSLGAFELQYIFKDYKTLGAKRYSGTYEENGEIKIKNTVSGIKKENVNKKVKHPRDFTQSLTWSMDESGNVLTVYNDYQKTITWTDIDGNVYESNQIYGVTLKPVEFSLSLRSTWSNMLSSVSGNVQIVNDGPKLNDPIYIKKALDKEDEMCYNIKG